MTANSKVDVATLGSSVILSHEVLLQEINGESVLLDLKSDQYFSLNAVGTTLWQLLAQNSLLRNAFDALLATYKVDAQRLESDVLSLVQELADAGLVEIT